jgi:hypothetical protein
MGKKYKPGDLVNIRFPDRLKDCRLGIVLSHAMDRHDECRSTGIKKTVPECLYKVYDVDKNEYVNQIHFEHLELLV